jgi:integrase
MKTSDAFNISPLIRARRSLDSGIWYLRHKNEQGKSIEYTTGIKGGRRDISRHVKDSGIDDMVAVAQAGCLTEDTVARIRGTSNVRISDVFEEWVAWMKMVGESPATVDSLAKRFLSYCAHFPKRIEWMGKLSQINIETINEWVNPEHSDIKLSTRRARLSGVVAFCKFAMGKGYIMCDPSSLVKVNMNLLTHVQKEVKGQEPIELAELKGILAVVSGDIRNLLAKPKLTPTQKKKLSTLRFWGSASILSYETGLRLGDCAQVEADCFDGENIIVWTDKRDRRIKIPLDMLDHEMLVYMAAHYMVWVPKEGFIFPEQADTVKAGKTENLCMQFRRIADRAGVKKSFHGFRHSRITRWHDEGLSLEAIGDMVAHKNKETTIGYL